MVGDFGIWGLRLADWVSCARFKDLICWRFTLIMNLFGACLLGCTDDLARLIIWLCKAGSGLGNLCLVFLIYLGWAGFWLGLENRLGRRIGWVRLDIWLSR